MTFRYVFVLLILVCGYCKAGNYKIEESAIDSSVTNIYKPLSLNMLEANIIPNMLTKSEIKIVKKWFESMIHYSYQEFDDRRGITWDDYWYDREKKDVIAIDDDKKNMKITALP